MKYWVIFNNKQEGPFSMEELSRYPLTLQTPVWHQGLDRWVPAQEVAELRYMIEQKSQPAQTIYSSGPYVNPTRSVPSAAPAVNAGQKSVDQQPAGQQPVDQQPAGQQPVDQQPAGQQPVGQQYKPQINLRMNKHDGAERPSTYLGWAIAATLLCCLPIGVVAIIYAAGVNTKFDRGDIEGARKASERAQLWIILSIVLGLIWMPVYTIIQMLAQM